MNLTTRQKRMGLPIEFYTIPFNDRVSLPKPRVPRIEGATCCAVGIKPLSRDPTGPRRKVDELTSPARAFDRSNPPDRVKEFSFKAGGGSYSKLFDGTEKLLSWDNILWINRTVSVP